MDCPKCAGELEEKIEENLKVNVCFICEGIWFDAGELEKVLKADSRDFEFLGLDSEDLAGKEAADLLEKFDKKESKCPRCADSTKLVRKIYKGKHKVNVETCPKCNGIWLEGGEIQELRSRGLVNLVEAVEGEGEFLKYAFSRDGFRDFIQNVFHGRNSNSR